MIIVCTPETPLEVDLDCHYRLEGNMRAAMRFNGKYIGMPLTGPECQTQQQPRESNCTKTLAPVQMTAAAVVGNRL
jgi:hypothetical protein